MICTLNQVSSGIKYNKLRFAPLEVSSRNRVYIGQNTNEATKSSVATAI
jgi:hypothetical protein